MEPRIGSDLRRARTRREIELSEVEAATRIRVRFLAAIEAEDWDVLPGGVYTRGFIRTYASYLGLDGERLAEDYRREVEGAQGGRPPARELAPVAATAATGSPGGRRAHRYLRWLAVPAVLAVAVVAVVAFSEDGGGPGSAAGDGASRPTPAATTRPEAAPARPERAAGAGVSLRLRTKAEVWVCLLDAQERPLVEGQVVAAGEELGPFRSGSFTVAFGNGEVEMLVDGRQADIAATSSPVGYSVDGRGELAELSEAERPTCL